MKLVTAKLILLVRETLTGSLFTYSFLAQPVGYFFINFAPVTDGEDPDHSIFAIGFANNAKPPDFDFP